MNTRFYDPVSPEHFIPSHGEWIEYRLLGQRVFRKGIWDKIRDGACAGDDFLPRRQLAAWRHPR